MTKAPIRIVHVFGRMGLGGAETALMNALRRMDWQTYQCDFVVHRRRAGEFDSEIRAMGGRIHVIESYRNPPRYALELGAFLSRGGYDIVHSHVSHFSGYVLAIARAAGVPGRIAHSHTAVPERGDSPARRAYKRLMGAGIHTFATCGLGCSAAACASLFGPRWQHAGKYQVLPYGYDFARFAALESQVRSASRRALGVADSDRVIGHIGRFVTPKNHDFIIELAAALRYRGVAGHKFVLVGDGERRPAIEKAISARGLGDAFILTGQRSDIPELLSAFDVMIQPSLWEGLGVTILEAQATAVPCIVSERVPGEATVIPELVTACSLDDMDAWIDAVVAARPSISRDQALLRMNNSEVAIDVHLGRLTRIYEREARHRQGTAQVRS